MSDEDNEKTNEVLAIPQVPEPTELIVCRACKRITFGDDSLHVECNGDFERIAAGDSLEDFEIPTRYHTKHLWEFDPWLNVREQPPARQGMTQETCEYLGIPSHQCIITGFVDEVMAEGTAQNPDFPAPQSDPRERVKAAHIFPHKLGALIPSDMGVDNCRCVLPLRGDLAQAWEDKRWTLLPHSVPRREDAHRQYIVVAFGDENENPAVEYHGTTITFLQGRSPYHRILAHHASLTLRGPHSPENIRQFMGNPDRSRVLLLDCDLSEYSLNELNSEYSESDVSESGRRLPDAEFSVLKKLKSEKVGIPDNLARVLARHFPSNNSMAMMFERDEEAVKNRLRELFESQGAPGFDVAVYVNIVWVKRHVFESETRT